MFDDAKQRYKQRKTPEDAPLLFVLLMNTKWVTLLPTSKVPGNH
jgi:hypothetical protein